MLLSNTMQLAKRLRATAVRRCLTSLVRPQMYCPRTHTWLRPQAKAASQRDIVAVGLTERLCEDVGDVTMVTPLVAPGELVVSGAPLLRIEWTALHISDGDELYHTTWANAEGSTTVFAPCEGKVVEVNLSVEQSGDVDAERWLLTLETSGELPAHCVDEGQYLQECGTGKFGESDESLSYTSYG